MTFTRMAMLSGMLVACATETARREPPVASAPAWLVAWDQSFGSPARGRPAAELALTLPTAGGEPFSLRHVPSGVGVRVALEDGPAGSGRVVAGGVHFEGERELVLRPRPEGVEDYVLVHAGSEVRHRFRPRAAGLRLVGNVLELLDDAGAPRLRASRSWILDAAGVRRRASLDVEGCLVDRDPRAPWGRPPLPVGGWCTLVVRWDDTGLTYPLVVDPLWSVTTEMAEARYGHATQLLSDGRVLVAGGTVYIFGTTTASAELYDAATNSWATTASLSAARQFPGWSELDDGGVLVSAGDVSETSAEIYREGVWEPTGAHAVARASLHTLTRLADGGVLAVGGDQDGVIERYDPTSESWSAIGALNHPRRGHSATLLDDGRVLIASGFFDGTERLPSTEIVDPSTGESIEVDDIDTPRSSHGALRLDDGTVMVVGGVQVAASKEVGVESSELFDPTELCWVQGPDMSVPRFGMAVARLPSGDVLVAGGSLTNDPLGSLSSAEIYADGTFTPVEDLALPRSFAGVATLPSGAVLVTGGWNMGGGVDGIHASSELFEPQPLGEPCSLDGECASGVCADGVCCNTVCEGCMACTAALKGDGPDGTCGPAQSGSDPHGVCADDCGPQTCGGDGSCVSAGPADTTLCNGFTCIDGTCLDSCVDVDDCVTGYVCNGDRLCVPAPPPTRSSGCGCEVGAPARPRPWLAAALCLLACTRRRALVSRT